MASHLIVDAVFCALAGSRVEGTNCFRQGPESARALCVVCKTVAKATVVRIHYPPHASRFARDLGRLGSGPILLVRPSPAPSGCLRAFTGT